MHSLDLGVKKVTDRLETARNTVLLMLTIGAGQLQKIAAGSILFVWEDLSDLMLHLDCIHLSARQGSKAYLNISISKIWVIDVFKNHFDFEVREAS